MARIQAIADKLPKAQGLILGDHGYKAICINDAIAKINKFYEGTPAQAPSERTIQDWFYKNSFPNWAVAVLCK
jgi:hypothetical protein